MLKVYGSSDDRIEVEGDVREEFGAYSPDNEPFFLAASDGTVLRITYGTPGSIGWEIKPLAVGFSFSHVDPATDEVEDYSDKAHFSGPVAWVTVAHGEYRFARAKPAPSDEREG